LQFSESWSSNCKTLIKAQNIHIRNGIIIPGLFYNKYEDVAEMNSTWKTSESSHFLLPICWQTDRQTDRQGDPSPGAKRCCSLWIHDGKKKMMEMERRYTKLTGKGGSMPSSSSCKKRLGWRRRDNRSVSSLWLLFCRDGDNLLHWVARVWFCCEDLHTCVSSSTVWTSLAILLEV
jgi:hypothetical protein